MYWTWRYKDDNNADVDGYVDDNVHDNEEDDDDDDDDGIIGAHTLSFTTTRTLSFLYLPRTVLHCNINVWSWQ